MIRIYFFVIAVLLVSCVKSVDSPSVPVTEKSINGYWDVTESVTKDGYPAVISNSSFTGETAKINDTVFAIIQNYRNTFTMPWAGLTADSVFLLLRPKHILYNGYQGEIGTYADQLDTLDLKYFYGYGPTIYFVTQHWVKNKNITQYPPADPNAYDKPFANDSLQSIVIAGYNSVYRIGDMGKLSWHKTIPDGYEVFDGILLNSGLLFILNNNEKVYAFNYSTGAITPGFNNPPTGFYSLRGFPAVDNGKLYVSHKRIRQFDVATGNLTNDDVVPWMMDSESSPFYVNNHILYSGTRHAFGALNLATGVQQWSIEPFRYLSSLAELKTMPIVVNNVFYMVFEDGNLVAFNATTGSYKWTSKLTAGTSVTTAIAGNGLLYFGSSDGKLYAVDLVTGNVKWTFDAKYPLSATPVLSNNRIYFGSPDGSMNALDANTGTKIWSYTTSNAIMASAAILNNVLYFVSANNNVYAVDASNGRKIWSYRLEGFPNTLGKSIVSPVLVTSSGRFVSAFSSR